METLLSVPTPGRGRRRLVQPGGTQLPKLGTSLSDQRRAGTRFSPFQNPLPLWLSPVPLGNGATREERKEGLGVPQPSASERLSVPRRPLPREGRSGRDHLKRWRGGKTRRGRGAGRLSRSRLLSLGRSPVFQVDEVFFFFF